MLRHSGEGKAIQLCIFTNLYGETLYSLADARRYYPKKVKAYLEREDVAPSRQPIPAQRPQRVPARPAAPLPQSALQPSENGRGLNKGEAKSVKAVATRQANRDKQKKNLDQNNAKAVEAERRKMDKTKPQATRAASAAPAAPAASAAGRPPSTPSPPPPPARPQSFSTLPSKARIVSADFK